MKRHFSCKLISVLVLLSLILAAAPAGTLASPMSDGETSLKALFYKGCSVDSQYSFVRNVKLRQSVSDLLACFGESSNKITVLDKSMTQKTEGYVGTGDTVAMQDAAGGILDSLTIVISGDIDGDGYIKSSDYLKLKRSFAGSIVFNSAESAAADYNGDGKHTSSDYLQIKRFMSGAPERDQGFYLDGEYENNSDIAFWYTHSTQKTLRKESAPEKRMTSYTVHLARNEMEGVQLNLQADRNYTGITAEVSAFEDNAGNTLNNSVYLEYYISCDDWGGVFPDALVPMPEQFDLQAGYNQAIYIRAEAGADAKPGYYRAEVTLRQGETELFRGEIWAHVWDFVLPEATSCQTLFGYDTNSINQYDPDSSKKEYYDFMLDNYRVNCFYLPYNLTNSKVDQYLDNPKIQNFRVRTSSQSQMQEDYEKLSQNQEWMDKHFFYPMDEPDTPEKLAQSLSVISTIKSIFGEEANIIVPLSTTVDANRNSLIEPLVGQVNMWCLNTWAASFSQGLRNVKRAMQEGDELWGYVSCNPGPEKKFLNVFITMQGLKTREIFWELQRNGCSGFLYWSTTYWKQIKANPWEDMLTLQDTNLGPIYGDGSLLYPGEYIGTPGPIGTIRFECIRDGLDDYDYMEMAKELGFEDTVNEMITKVSKDFTISMDDPDEFARIRIELGNLIEANL